VNSVVKYGQELLMVLTDKIQEYLNKLSEPIQAEVLHYVEYLFEKTSRQSVAEDEVWYNFSLSQALSDIKDEEELYTFKDLKVHFS
jgi:hypothetical protein